jgi:hypothetical protein
MREEGGKSAPNPNLDASAEDAAMAMALRLCQTGW